MYPKHLSGIMALKRFIPYILSHSSPLVNITFIFSFKILHEHFFVFYRICTKEIVFMPFLRHSLPILHNFCKTPRRLIFSEKAAETTQNSHNTLNGRGIQSLPVRSCTCPVLLYILHKNQVFSFVRIKRRSSVRNVLYSSGFTSISVRESSSVSPERTTVSVIVSPASYSSLILFSSSVVLTVSPWIPVIMSP